MNGCPTPGCLLNAHTPGCLPGNASPHTRLLAEHCSHTRLLAHSQARQCFPHTRLSARCNVFPTLDTASPTPSIASLHTSPHTQQCFSTHPALVLHTPNCSPMPSNASSTPNIASLHPATSPYAGHCFLTHFSTHPAAHPAMLPPHNRCLVRVMPGLSARATLSVICSSTAMHTSQLLYYIYVMSCKVCFLLRDCTAQRSGIRLHGALTNTQPPYFIWFHLYPYLYL